jgi:hypothetical protein
MFRGGDTRRPGTAGAHLSQRHTKVQRPASRFYEAFHSKSF